MERYWPYLRIGSVQLDTNLSGVEVSILINDALGPLVILSIS